MKTAKLSLIAATVLGLATSAQADRPSARSEGHRVSLLPMCRSSREIAGHAGTEGIETETIAFDGASKMDLGMTSGSVDITLGRPTEIAAIAKGMPAKAVAIIARPVRELAIIVPYDSPLKSIKELKGKTRSASPPSARSRNGRRSSSRARKAGSPKT